MQQKNTCLAKILTYSGTMLLIACAVCAVAPSIIPLADIHTFVIAKTYSAMILSFLCGIHWACYLFFAERCPRHLLLISNALALLAWLTLLVGHQSWGLSLHIFCFLYLLTLDHRLCAAGILPPWFYALRRNATMIVATSLGLVAMFA